MSDISEFFGAASQPRIHEIVIAARTWVAPAAGRLYFLGVASGGSGACGNTASAASGGGAGEVAFELGLRVAANDSVIFTPGAGGASKSTAGAGNPGSDSTVTGPSGYSLTIKAGLGGAVLTSTGTAAGGAGGSGGSGGVRVIRLSGGRGGDVLWVSGQQRASGGGGVNVFGRTAQTGCKGGDITLGSGFVATGGGSPHGAAANDSTGAVQGPLVGLSAVAAGLLWGLELYGLSSANPAGPGASSPGATSSSTNPTSLFAGSGGSVDTPPTARSSGNAGYGAGSGGYSAGSGGSSGKGGDGLFVLIFVPD